MYQQLLSRGRGQEENRPVATPGWRASHVNRQSYLRWIVDPSFRKNVPSVFVLKDGLSDDARYRIMVRAP